MANGVVREDVERAIQNGLLLQDFDQLAGEAALGLLRRALDEDHHGLLGNKLLQARVEILRGHLGRRPRRCAQGLGVLFGGVGQLRGVGAADLGKDLSSLRPGEQGPERAYLDEHKIRHRVHSEALRELGQLFGLDLDCC